MAPLAEAELFNLGHTNDFCPPLRAVIEAPIAPFDWKPRQVWVTGAGDGRLIQAFIERCYTVVAVDIQEGQGFLSILQH
tara:strand:- start:916 stop:1152 length:237 start_codon:yes stop_codon:yes gene_type:complete